MVYLITGKKGAGKTRYANNLAEELKKEHSVLHLDGDEWRRQYNNNDYSDEGRVKNLMTAATFAAEYEAKDHVVILSFIAPRKRWRDVMRTMWRESKVVYIPGGILWENTTYEAPTLEEQNLKVQPS